MTSEHKTFISEARPNGLVIYGRLLKPDFKIEARLGSNTEPGFFINRSEMPYHAVRRLLAVAWFANVHETMMIGLVVWYRISVSSVSRPRDIPGIRLPSLAQLGGL